MIYIFVPFLADYDQNRMQMISLKNLLGCSQFQIIQIFVIVPGVVPYSFLTKRAARLCVLSMSFYLFLNVRIPCATSINSSCGLTKARQACCFTFSGHLLKFFLIKPLKRSVGFAYNSSNLDHWISQLQGICGDQQLPRVLRGWCVAQYFPFFLEQGLLIEHVLAMFLNQELF